MIDIICLNKDGLKNYIKIIHENNVKYSTLTQWPIFCSSDKTCTPDFKEVIFIIHVTIYGHRVIN